jgi:hypothetical protein
MLPSDDGENAMLHRMSMLVLIALSCLGGASDTEATELPAIVCPKEASYAEKLAGKEIRRYLYLRTGKLLPLVTDLPNPSASPDGLIVVGGKDRPMMQHLLSDAQLETEVAALAPNQYTLKTEEYAGRPALLVIGGDDVGTLYGAYRLAEHLGVRFYLHGDVIPDLQIPLELPVVNETQKPLFDHRGIQPFHDFPEGPDWWNRDTYKAILAQLPKMGLNFIGLHTYPESSVGPEPLVWIGPPNEIAFDGKVKASYPSHHFTVNNGSSAFGYAPSKTSDFEFGAADIFDRDDYGADYMRNTFPWEKMPAEQCNAVFDGMGDLLSDVFGFAHQLGIKTCIGTETPLTIPNAVKQRLLAAGKNPSDPAVVQEIYEGIFERIAKTHFLDYYWLWTPEGWTWTPVKQEQIDATTSDFRMALAAMQKVRPSFTLATCGWVLGPVQSPSLFDEFLPKEMPMSCINREVGNMPIEPGFAKVIGRPKWAIPWLEDDPGMTMPQLWAGRMRRDAADALKYGCTGLLGIHWRTRILAPNVSALAKAAWRQTGWKGEMTTSTDGKSQYSPVADFYTDWAQAEFGPDVAEPVANIFTLLDGHLPRPADWATGPGSLKPDDRPWEEQQKEYTFVEDLAALRPKIHGAGNLERFDYWLNNFRYLRSIAHVKTVRRRFDNAMKKATAEIDRESQKIIARELVLPVRIELMAAFAELYRHLLATVTNPGEMGNVANWQQQTLPVLLAKPGHELAKLLGGDLPAEAMPSKQYIGEPRLFLREVRTSLAVGEPLKLTVIILGGQPDNAILSWRRLGDGKYAKMPLEHMARGTYTATLPAEAIHGDFEYSIQATVGGASLSFPPTAPTIQQTVVVCE